MSEVLTYSLKIISKFKTNAHLILPYQGSQSGIGRPKTLGDKVNLDKPDDRFYVGSRQEEDSNIDTKIYQFQAFTPKISGIKLNIVLMVHTHQISQKISRAILFTNDLNLDANTLINYYALRFQIEFDFRDAKQFYGLSDFKNYKETQVSNAVNIAFTMTLIAKLILEKYKIKLNCPTMGILDLKTAFRAEKHTKILLNKAEFEPDDFFK